MPFNRDNPYGILVLAIPFFVGAIILLLRNEPSVVIASPVWRVPDAYGHYVETASVTMEHVAGIFGLVVGGFIVWFYFRFRQ